MAARPIRAVVVREQIHYRVVHHARPGSALPPPKPPKKGGGGWLVALGVVGALVVVGKLAGGDASPAPPSIHEIGRRVIVASKIEDERCLAPGWVKGQPITFMVDTGAPKVAEFPDSWARKLGLKNLRYEEFWPGTRYGKIATATVAEIRVGDVWKDAEARFYRNWSFSFGDTRPLLGLAALNARGVDVEFDGGSCRLTVPR